MMYIKIILISIFVLLVQHCCKIYNIMDFRRHIFNHYPGPCHRIEGVDFGSENMFMLSNGIVFITSGYRLIQNKPSYDKYYHDNKIKGRVLLFNFKNPQKVAKEMTLTTTENFDRDRFQPHGISGWEDKKSGQIYLFIVNHEKDGQEKIEKFQVLTETNSLKHVKSYFGDPTIKVLNDVVATGLDSFYFTNFHSVMSSYGQMFETLAFMPWQNVGYFDGNDFRIVADGMQMANGIDMSKDGSSIYVVTSTGEELRIFDRRPDNNLHLREIYPLYTKPDNVLVDPASGDLYIGAHPVCHLTMAHLAEPSARAPSQVLRVQLNGGVVSSVTEMFADNGNLITASTAAVIYNKKMLIGSIIDKLVYCDINIPM